MAKPSVGLVDRYGYLDAIPWAVQSRLIADTCTFGVVPINVSFHLSKKLISLLIKKQRRYPGHCYIGFFNELQNTHSTDATATGNNSNSSHACFTLIQFY